RWTKWSRGVRTRGLRVGAVGGPRPLFLSGESDGVLPEITTQVSALALRGHKKRRRSARIVCHAQATPVVAGDVPHRSRLFFYSGLPAWYCISRRRHTLTNRNAGIDLSHSLWRASDVSTRCSREPAWRRLYLDVGEFAVALERQTLCPCSTRFRDHEFHNHHHTLSSGCYGTHRRESVCDRAPRFPPSSNRRHSRTDCSAGRDLSSRLQGSDRNRSVSRGDLSRVERDGCFGWLLPDFHASGRVVGLE